MKAPIPKVQVLRQFLLIGAETAFRPIAEILFADLLLRELTLGGAV
jgi:hypothetical protein